MTPENFTTNACAASVAKALAWPALMRTMASSGVMACNPTYVSSALEKLWPDYLFYSEDAVTKIWTSVMDHPGGIEGLKADIRQANKDFSAAFPAEMDDL